MEACPYFRKSIEKICESVASLMHETNFDEVTRFLDALHSIDAEDKHVYVFGVGRSGNVGRSFVTRLTNMGYYAHFIGEPSTPAMRKGDALVVISGSGETPDVVNRTKTSKELGAIVFAVTSKPESSLGKLADYILYVPGRTKADEDYPVLEDSYENGQLRGFKTPLTPMGTLFEINAGIALDALIPELAHRKGIDERFMRELHFD
ncbi:MAG TPA: SIS domain-containing protein [Archaeoglobaceae archaeon]|nr:SIS domain-containing protein [Archaeoglobaceae archaeon]